MVANAQRVESIFLRHYRENVLDKIQGEKVEPLKPKRPVRRTAAAEAGDPAHCFNGDRNGTSPDPQAGHVLGRRGPALSDVEQAHLPEGQTDESEHTQQKASADLKELRRATRSTGRGIEDWMKIPVAATVRVPSGDLEKLDGMVYVSTDTGALFRQQGGVYFETMWRGSVHKYFIPDSELPMVSEDHFLFKEETARIEEDRLKRLSQAKHMLELGCTNEEATFDIEKKAADRTLESRKEELRERMLRRAEDIFEELEEEVAITSLPLIRESSAHHKSLAWSGSTPATSPSPARVRARRRRSGSEFSDAETLVLEKEIKAAHKENNVPNRSTRMTSSRNLSASAEMGPSDSQQQPLFSALKSDLSKMDSSSEGRTDAQDVEMECNLLKDENQAYESFCTNRIGVIEESGPVTPPSKRQKINAADLAICTLAIASDISTGLRETGYVRDYEYVDIHEVVVDKMFPDADWGEDQDLIV
ncbi:hypothetical protein NSK_003783 [Nannochloropsis salina CCMP1776]|uniref:Uncharacterized protein n=1 Tax=Nannochloropsis salina CCMP1776 TaxID=1027361 RepID=A0A4D9CZD4_9STRA|nr:hypothetical protein NSK_003783 [Nannochloropsis salina CCMP1776]|eukprot:TFJ84751.1 hypothetical protein NSK_003783 [Nannochloropsis salina CCMP1776]